MAKTVQIGRVEPEFNEKLVNYANLVGLSKIELIEELFNKEVEDKVLTSDFINIGSVYYFDFIELQKNKKVKATKEPDSTALSSTVIVKKIPNNLDVFDKTERTFCFNGVAEEHKGIYSYNKIVLNHAKFNESSLFQYYLLFEYNSATEELTVSLTNPENIALMLDISKTKEILSSLADFNLEFTKAIERVKKAPEGATITDIITNNDNYINLGLYITSILVIEPLSHAKSWSYAFLTGNKEQYESIIKDSGSDLILVREAIEKEDSIEFRTVNYKEGGSE